MTGLINISPHKIARIAGIGYLIIIAAGIFAEFIIRSNLIVWGDAAVTASNIAASQSMFRLSIAADLIMLLADVILALALYILLKPVSKAISLLAAFFRLVHTSVVGAGLLNLLFVTILLNGASYLDVFETDQLGAMTLTFLKAHSYGYVLGLVFFGVHCLILGYLIFKSGFLPKILGVLIIIAGAGYLIDSFANILLVNYAAYQNILMLVVFLPAFIGELSLALWLLIKGVKNIPGKPSAA